MSSSHEEPVEGPLKEDVQKEKEKQPQLPPLPRSKLETCIKKELEFLGVTQMMIGLICLFFGITQKFIPNYEEFETDRLSSFQISYPIWGGLLFAISGSLMIASERKDSKYLVQSSLAMAIVSSVIAGIGINILRLNLKQTSSILNECQNEPFGDFCFAANFLTETAAIVLLLTVMELSIGVLLSVNEIVGKVMETRTAKHPKVGHEALYEELAIYYPIAEPVAREERETLVDPNDTSTEPRESSLQSRSHQSLEEQQNT